MLRIVRTSLSAGLRQVRFGSTEAYTNALTKLKKDLKQAMIAKDEVRKTTIRGLLAEIKNKEIDSKSKDFDEFGLSSLYTKLIHQRAESIEEYKANGRQELAEKEQKEMDIISGYLEELPVATKEEVDAKVKTFLEELKNAEPDLQLKQIFGKVDWKVVTVEWKASQSMIKASIASQFKSIFS